MGQTCSECSGCCTGGCPTTKICHTCTSEGGTSTRCLDKASFVIPLSLCSILLVMGLIIFVMWKRRKVLMESRSRGDENAGAQGDLHCWYMASCSFFCMLATLCVLLAIFYPGLTEWTDGKKIVAFWWSMFVVLTLIDVGMCVLLCTFRKNYPPLNRVAVPMASEDTMTMLSPTSTSSSTTFG